MHKVKDFAQQYNMLAYLKTKVYDPLVRPLCAAPQGQL